MAVEATLPQIATIVITALIDSVNPCAIGVLILLVTVLMSHAKDKGKVLSYGTAYILAVMLTYLLAGLGLLYFLHTIPLWITQYLSIIIAIALAFAGLVEIKDYFWYGQGFSLAIPANRAKDIHKLTKNITLPGVIFLGAFVSAVELPCTGAPYLAILTILSHNFNFAAFMLLVLYNIIFVLPLWIILFLVYFGTKVSIIKQWKHANRANMRMAIGVLLIILSWMLIVMSSWLLSID